MRRLYLQIYATVVAIVVAVRRAGRAAWWMFGPGRARSAASRAASPNGAGECCRRPSARSRELQAALDRLGARLRRAAHAARDTGGALARRARAAGARRSSGARASHAAAPTAALRSDGRPLVAALARPTDRLARLRLVALAVAVALGAWPLVRRLTRRLERLRARSRPSARRPRGARAVRGRDEVADLARSFNRAAERIQKLVEAQRRQLAFASHELRSPLARLRVAIEMEARGDALRARAARDVARARRADRRAAREPARGLGRRRRAPELVDLLGLVAEEAARTGAVVSGEPVLRGDARLLRRLVRNLLDNARRHAGGTEVRRGSSRARTARAPRVADRGPGVPESERERIFEPFYRPPGAPETGRRLRPRPRARAADRARPRWGRDLPAARRRRNHVRSPLGGDT